MAKSSTPAVVEEDVVAGEDEEPEVLVAGEDYPEGEPQIILGGYWVRLGSTDKVPEEVRGHIAAVTYAPIENHQGGESELSPRPYQTQSKKAQFTVETRDQYNMVIPGLTRKDFTEVAHDRVTIESHG